MQLRAGVRGLWAKTRHSRWGPQTRAEVPRAGPKSADSGQGTGTLAGVARLRPKSRAPDQSPQTLAQSPGTLAWICGRRPASRPVPSPLRGFWFLGVTATWGFRPRLYAFCPSGLAVHAVWLPISVPRGWLSVPFGADHPCLRTGTSTG